MPARPPTVDYKPWALLVIPLSQG